MLNYVVDLITPPLNAVKKLLVGDLQWRDIKSILSSAMPIGTKFLTGMQARDRRLYIDTPQDPTEIYGFNYGLLGLILPYNVAYMRPKNESTTKIKALLNEVDSLPESRKYYQHFSDLSNTPMFIATSGVEGTIMRKKFVALLPNSRKALETAIAQTKAANIPLSLPEHREDQLIRAINEGAEKLIRSIMLELMLDLQWMTPYTNTLLDRISTVLLQPYVTDSTIKHDYHKFVRCIVNNFLENSNNPGSSPLAKIIEAKKKLIDWTKPEAQKELLNELCEDSEIHALFTALITANNIATLVRVTLFNFDKLETLNYMKKIANEIGNNQTTEQDFSAILNSKSLDCVYKEALRISHLVPNTILRYVSKPLSSDGITIPAKTTLTILHRDLQNDDDAFNPNNFEKDNALKLGTPAFAPFSLGDRACPGQDLTKKIFKGVISTFARSKALDEALAAKIAEQSVAPTIALK
ncbi:MAG: cytochrome P450 [Legionella sp.]|jgi:hypothetical protein